MVLHIRHRHDRHYAHQCGNNLTGKKQYVIPEGYELIDLPPCKMMVFQGEAYNDDDFMGAIDEVWKHIEKFDPAVYGYQWVPEAAPRFQLAPMGYRGYIEARPVEALN
jgi:hypothetical protein